MRNFDQAWADAVDRTPFSNSAEGDAWMDNWCARCVHDARFQQTGDGAGCPLMVVAVLGRTPVEWIDQRPSRHVLGDTYHCTEFRDTRGGGDDDDPAPEPTPVIDGQSDVFEVFAEQVIEQARRSVERAGVA